MLVMLVTLAMLAMPTVILMCWLADHGGAASQNKQEAWDLLQV